MANDLWVRMEEEGGVVPEDNSGIPRTVHNASDIWVEGVDKMLSEMTPAEQRAHRWYPFEDLTFVDERTHERGPELWANNDVEVTRSFPNPVMRDIAVLRKHKQGEARGQYKRHHRTMLFETHEYDASIERAGVVGLLLATTRGPGYRVRTTAGVFVPMNNPTFRNYAAQMADHIDGIETRWLQYVEDLDAETDPVALLAVDTTQGW